MRKNSASFGMRLINSLLKLPKNPITDRLALSMIRRQKDFQPLKARGGNYFLAGGSDPEIFNVRASVILGQYETGLMRLLARLVKSDESVIDVGANEGYISIFLADRVGPNGHIFAIEPHPGNIRILQENINLNDLTNITVIPKGIGDQRGCLLLHGDGAWGTLLDRTHLDEGEVEVEVVTLDSIFKDEKILNNLSLIKIDTEGYEIRVIRGAYELISSKRPMVVFEINLSLLAYEEISIKEVFDYFLSKDYLIYKIHGGNGKIIPFTWLDDRICNLLAMPKEHVTNEWLNSMLAR